MAATFEVETGSGSATANSYVSEAVADQYHENYGDPSAWSGATQAVKEEALRIATQYLDVRYHGRWRGETTYRTQRLAWPRTDAERREGFFWDPNVIPEPLQEACAALALEHINASAGLLPNLASGGAPLKAKTSGVGALRSSKEYFGPSREAPEFPVIDGVLAPLLKGGGGQGVLRRG